MYKSSRELGQNWREIDGKHALQIYQNNCGSDIVLHYSVFKLNAYIKAAPWDDINFRF